MTMTDTPVTAGAMNFFDPHQASIGGEYNKRLTRLSIFPSGLKKAITSRWYRGRRDDLNVVVDNQYRTINNTVGLSEGPPLPQSTRFTYHF